MPVHRFTTSHCCVCTAWHAGISLQAGTCAVCEHMQCGSCSVHTLIPTPSPAAAAAAAAPSAPPASSGPAAPSTEPAPEPAPQQDMESEIAAVRIPSSPPDAIYLSSLASAAERLSAASSTAGADRVASSPPPLLPGLPLTAAPARPAHPPPAAANGARPRAAQPLHWARLKLVDFIFAFGEYPVPHQ